MLANVQNFVHNAYNNLPTATTVGSVVWDKTASIGSDVLGISAAKKDEAKEKPQLLTYEIKKTSIPSYESYWRIPFSNAALVFNYNLIKDIPYAIVGGTLLCGTGILGLAYETGLYKKWPFVSERFGTWPSEAANAVGYFRNVVVLPLVSGVGRLIASTNESSNANLILGLTSLFLGYRMVWKSPAFSYLEFKFNDDHGASTCSLNYKNILKDMTKVATGVSFIAGGILLLDKSFSGNA